MSYKPNWEFQHFINYKPELHGEVTDIVVGNSSILSVFGEYNRDASLLDAFIHDEPDLFPIVEITTTKGKFHITNDDCEEAYREVCNVKMY